MECGPIGVVHCWSLITNLCSLSVQIRDDHVDCPLSGTNSQQTSCWCDITAVCLFKTSVSFAVVMTTNSQSEQWRTTYRTDHPIFTRWPTPASSLHPVTLTVPPPHTVEVRPQGHSVVCGFQLSSSSCTWWTGRSPKDNKLRLTEKRKKNIRSKIVLV